MSGFPVFYVSAELPGEDWDYYEGFVVVARDAAHAEELARACMRQRAEARADDYLLRALLVRADSPGVVLLSEHHG